MTDSGNRNGWNLSLAEFRAEIGRLRASTLDGDLTEAQHVDNWVRLRDLMQEAMAGTLRFAPPGNQAEVMIAEPHIIELRPMPEKLQGDGAPLRLLRLYLAEPVMEPRTLLALHLATKPNGPDTLSEQTISVRRAAQRAQDWAS